MLECRPTCCWSAAMYPRPRSGYRPGRHRFSRTWRAGCPARSACRLPKRSHGTACKRLSRCMGDRAPRRPRIDRHIFSTASMRWRRRFDHRHSIDSGRKIFLVQLADAPQLGLDILSWSRHFRCFPGQGDLPVPDFMESVIATAMRGRSRSKSSTTSFAPARGAHRHRRAAVADLAAGSPCGHEREGIAGCSRAEGAVQRCRFLEFAVNETKAGDLAICLATRLSQTGKHRSKAVERWSRARSNWSSIARADGFAHSHYITHGPGCARSPRRRQRQSYHGTRGKR